jgi:uncharacterized protein YcbX
MQGARVEAVDVDASGITGDRAWAIVDAASGHALSAKTVPELLHATARVDAAGGSGVSVQLPDGPEVTAGDAAADEVLSRWLGRTVALRPRPDHAQVSYEMTFDPPDDTAERFEIPSPEGTYFDLAALHVLTTNALAACERAHPEGAWVARRFRPNVLADVAADDEYPEDAWVGRSVRIGGVTIDVLMRTVRCAMPLRAQPETPADVALERDVDVYRTMSNAHENHLGVYASVRTPGTITIGDPIELA